MLDTTTFRKLMTPSLALAATFVLGGGTVQAAGGPRPVLEVEPLITAPEGAPGVARCPGGKVMTSGGFVQSTAGSEFILDESAPGSIRAPARARTGEVPRRWFATVSKETPHEGRVFALCAPSVRARLVVNKVRLGNGEAGRDILRCEKGEVALGGGVVTPASGTYVIGSSGPVDDSGHPYSVESGDRPTGWIVDWTTADPATFQTSVVCVRNSEATMVVQHFSSYEDQEAAAAAHCPPGQRVLGGGALTVNSPEHTYLSGSGPLDAEGITANVEDGEVATQWYAGVGNFSQRLLNHKAIAICE